MADDSIFLGLITHRASRYRASAEEQLAGLALAARELGFRVEALVSDRDDFDAQETPLEAQTIRASADYQVDLEYRWRRYLAEAGGGRSRLQDLALRGAMGLRRRRRTDAQTLRRLLNIDLSHLRILDAASASDWALVLEDDAWAEDPRAAMAAVAEVVASAAAAGAEYAVVSDSIATDILGIDRLLRPLDVGGPLAGRLFRAARPVTNTVCATVYRGDFAGRLGRAISARGLVPVAPIDWRVNEALMTMVAAREAGGDTCLVVRPGIFRQRSMHPRSERP